MKKTLTVIVLGAVIGAIAGLPANAEDLSPSPIWGRAMPSGPDARVKITEPYARMVARDAYFWAWPMLNIYNKRLGFGQAPEPRFPSPGSGGGAETKWVFPDKLIDQLPLILADATPFPGEEARYAQMLAVVEAAKQDPALKKAVIDEAAKTESEMVAPLLQFRNWGLQLPHNWSTTSNNAAFGTDTFTRTAVAKSNILVNAPLETKYFYQDLDASGARLNSANRYTVTFAKDQTPPVNGFWSLTLYDVEHFFAPNDLKRYSVGTKNKTLVANTDGSLTIYVQADPPPAAQRPNWLPAPKGADFSLFMRAYWPKTAIIDGSWTPPAVQRMN